LRNEVLARAIEECKINGRSFATKQAFLDFLEKQKCPFTIRSSEDNRLRIECPLSGEPQSTLSANAIRNRQKESKKTDCPWHLVLRFRVTEGAWFITTFISHHNHHQIAAKDHQDESTVNLIKDRLHLKFKPAQVKKVMESKGINISLQDIYYLKREKKVRPEEKDLSNTIKLVNAMERKRQVDPNFEFRVHHRSWAVGSDLLDH